MLALQALQILKELVELIPNHILNLCKPAEAEELIILPLPVGTLSGQNPIFPSSIVDPVWRVTQMIEIVDYLAREERHACR